jgi:DNA-binding NarL/FixJ family response regulator
LEVKQHKRIRIAVIDGHRLFAEVVATRLSVEPDLQITGVAGSSTEAMELFSRNEIDVVTLDLALTGEDGLAVGRKLLAQWPNLGIVIVTGSADSRRVSEAVQMGVLGWVSKEGAVETLLIAVRGAARGETHLPAGLLTQVLAALSDPGRLSPEAGDMALLTAREMDVLRCLMNGRSRNEVGALLQISPNTVRTHIQSILHKLKVHSTLMAVTFARRAGVVEVRHDEVIPSNGADCPHAGQRFVPR